MSAKALLVLCAQALFIQSVFCQCTSRAAIDASGVGAPFAWPGNIAGAGGLAYPGLAAPGLGCSGLAGGLATGLGSAFGGLEVSPTSGGALAVTSSSAIAPTGISVVSENMFEGALSVTGELPFVGTTGMEGALPTAGAGAINHNCGDGHVAMISEATVAPGTTLNAAGPIVTPSAAIAPGAAFTPASAAYGTAFGASPYARRFGLGPCGQDIVY